MARTSPSDRYFLTLSHTISFHCSLRRELDAYERLITVTSKEVSPLVCNGEPQLAGL